MSWYLFLKRGAWAFTREFLKVPAQLVTPLVATFKEPSYYCSCCQRTCLFWLDYDQYYKAVLCPLCGSHPRHRALMWYLQEIDKMNFHFKSLLHVAPESIFQKYFRNIQNLNYVTCDIQRLDVDIRCDISNTPFDDNSFDVVICCHVLEHVQNDRKALDEIRRVLKPRGWAFVNVPLDKSREQTYEDPSLQTPQERLKAFLREDHLRLYGQDYAQRLIDAGFNVRQIKMTDYISAPDGERFGINPNEDLYFAEKS